MFDNRENLNVGDDVMANNGAGEIIVKITAIEGDKVTVDANHPYAGMDVVFEIGVMDVRETTPEDLSFFYQGHGHNHDHSCGGGGCGCGGDSGCDTEACGCEGSCDSSSCGCGH